MVKVSKANVYLKGGLGLDQWSDAIIDGSRNDKSPWWIARPTSMCWRSRPVRWMRRWATFTQWQPALLARSAQRRRHRAHHRGCVEQDRPNPRGGPRRARVHSPSSAPTPMTPTKDRRWIPNRVFTYHRSWHRQRTGSKSRVSRLCQHPHRETPRDLVNIAKSRKIGLLIQEPYFSSDAGKFLEREAGTRSSCALVRHRAGGQLSRAHRRRAAGAHGRRRIVMHALADAFALPLSHRALHQPVLAGILRTWIISAPRRALRRPGAGDGGARRRRRVGARSRTIRWRRIAGAGDDLRGRRAFAAAWPPARANSFEAFIGIVFATAQAAVFLILEKSPSGPST